MVNYHVIIGSARHGVVEGTTEDPFCLIAKFMDEEFEAAHITKIGAPRIPTKNRDDCPSKTFPPEGC